jgi:prepilin-type N-terminal cleavage/methylation domain-containing protein
MNTQHASKVGGSNALPREAGFTLVEVVIAVAIGATVSTMLFMALSHMIRARQSVVGFSTPYAIGPQILDAIEADLRNAYFYDLKENDCFWGADKELEGREADGLSFVASSLGHEGREDLLSNITIGQESEPHRRRSPTTEVQYVCRQSKTWPGCFELWRREDFYVDDSIHEGGSYRLVYDRVFDFKLEYVSRSTSTGGMTGSQDKTAEQMRLDSWSAIEERGLPRAVIVSISIYAREPEQTWEHEPQVFLFRRWIPLPQVHESTQSEGQIATWDGTIKEPTGPGVAPQGKKANGKGGGSFNFGAGGGAGRGGGAGNPFGALLQNRAPKGGSHTNTTFQQLFQPH